MQYYIADGELYTDTKQETIARLNLTQFIMPQLYPYIEQQLLLYNRLDICDIYSPQNKHINFKEYYSVFIIIKTSESEVFGINY